jgi:hypothetical protein
MPFSASWTESPARNTRPTKDHFGAPSTSWRTLDLRDDLYAAVERQGGDSLVLDPVSEGPNTAVNLPELIISGSRLPPTRVRPSGSPGARSRASAEGSQPSAYAAPPRLLDGRVVSAHISDGSTDSTPPLELSSVLERYSSDERRCRLAAAPG